MSKLDFLIEIRQKFVARVLNYGLESVMTEYEWKKLALEAAKKGLTFKQEEFLLSMGITKEELDKAKKEKEERSAKGVF